MELLIFYKTLNSAGRIPVTVNKDEVYFEGIKEIENRLKESLNQKELIITNIMKLPIK